MEHFKSSELETYESGELIIFSNKFLCYAGVIITEA